jgi:hypothetical protein
MFRASSCPSSGATTALTASGFTLERGDSSAVGRGLTTTWRRPKHVEREKTSSNKLVKLLHLVG